MSLFSCFNEPIQFTSIKQSFVGKLLGAPLSHPLLTLCKLTELHNLLSNNTQRQLTYKEHFGALFQGLQPVFCSIAFGPVVRQQLTVIEVVVEQSSPSGWEAKREE